MRFAPDQPRSAERHVASLPPRTPARTTAPMAGVSLPAAPSGASSGSAHEFPFTSREFERVQRLIHQRAGISLHAGKQSMVYNRLARRLRACRLTSFSQYLDRLDDPNSTEWEAFVNALTTNLTAFFREGHHFPVLAQHLASLKHQSEIRIWCTAASTGEEPYTIAMTALEALGNSSSRLQILASDIDTEVLLTAGAGEYQESATHAVDPALLRKYFLRGTNERSGQVKARPALRDRITFQRINLLDPVWPRMGPFDAVFCRNVMIYFDKPTQQRIIERFAGVMPPGALLFCGHSEHIASTCQQFRLQGKTVYSRTDA